MRIQMPAIYQHGMQKAVQQEYFFSAPSPREINPYTSTAP
jgi:hypothetical protein